MSEQEEPKDPKKMSVKELEEYISKNKSLINSSHLNKKSKKTKGDEIPPRNPPRCETSYGYLHFNYLANVENQITSLSTGDEPEKLIIQLQNQNNELRADIKKLFYLSDQNKNELEKKLKDAAEENYSLKKEIFELRNKIILQENKIKHLKTDKDELTNEKKILKKKFENEIIELNCQLNDYETKLNALNFEYQNLAHNYYVLKEEVTLEQGNFHKGDKCRDINEEAKQNSTIEEVRNLREHIKKYDNNLNEIKDKLSILENNTNARTMTNELNQMGNAAKEPRRKKIGFAVLHKKSKTPNRKGFIKAAKSKSKNTGFVPSSNQTPNRRQNELKIPTLKNIGEEIFELERKIADLNVSYQTFLSQLKKLPNNSFKQSQELKQTLKYLEDTINSKNEKLKELKDKQQKFLINALPK